jgi:beta-barrel assembly-enhancing protease
MLMYPRILALVLGITLVSVGEEIEIGKQADLQVRQKVTEWRDSQTTAYVRSLGRQLSRGAPGPKYPYRFSVADYREINAFALPGGPVWIHRGVLQSATNESQVAGVLAHEIAHVAQRHAADQLTKTMMANWGLSVLGAMLGNSGGAGTAQVAAGLLANGVFLKFSRDDEREADEVGVQIMRRAGWDARGMTELFEILRKEQRRDPGSVELFFSTHPSPQDRIARLQGAVAKSRGGRRDSQQFQAIRMRLLKLPAAKAMPRG